MCVYTLVQRSLAALSSAKSPDLVALKARLLLAYQKGIWKARAFLLALT